MNPLPPGLRLAFFFCALLAFSVAAGLRTIEIGDFSATLPPPSFAVAPIAARSELHAGTPAAHASALARLPDGEVLAYWFAGTREGAGDVRIFGARWRDGRWSDAEAVLAVRDAMAAEWRFLRKLGNPVAVVDARARLHLFFVSVSVGGWATSNLNQMVSDDGGRTWGRARVLVTSPFLNLSTLARTAAVQRRDGGFDLPVYHEGARKFPELLRFDALGHNFQKKRITAAHGLLQPAVVALDQRRALALLRNGAPDRRLRVVRTEDGGRTWSDTATADQANPDASVAVARLADGTLLMAYNPRSDGRSELALATSVDGLRWQHRRVVEFEAGGEFSYPALLVASDDEIHLTYTWQRKHIRHLRFNRAWLNAGAKESAQ